MATTNLKLPLSFNQLFELVQQLPSEKKKKIYKSLSQELAADNSVSKDVKKLLQSRLKYIKSGKAKAYSMEDTLLMLNEK